LVVPAGVTKIDKIVVACAADGLNPGDSRFFLRLGGNAVQGGEQVIPISTAGTIEPQSGSDGAPQIQSPFILEDCEIVVSPSDTISVWVEMAGTDLGTAYPVTTLLFA
jgi:hypothetical protein